MEKEQKKLISIEKQKMIEDYISEKQQNFFENLIHLCHGYSIVSLEQILPADIPTIIVAGEVSDLEIRLIKNIRKKTCVIAIDTSLEMLLSEDIIPDFFMGDGYRIKGNLKEEILCNISMITSTNDNCDVLREHIGKKFFYWSGNSWELFLCNSAKEKASRIYRYNELISVTEEENICEKALGIATYMGASQIIAMGKEFVSFQFPQKLGAYYVTSGENMELYQKIEKICCVEVEVSSILEKVIPFFDMDGKEGFYAAFQQMIEQSGAACQKIVESIKWYEKLYAIALNGEATQDELSEITTALNKNTEYIEGNASFPYALEILKGMNKNIAEDSLKEMECPNDIARVAIDGMYTFEKLNLIYEKLLDCAEDIKDTLKERKNEDFTKCIFKKRPSVLLVYGKSQYNVLPYFAKGLKKGFQRLKYDTYILDAYEQSETLGNGYNHFQRTVGYDYIVLMNGVCVELPGWDNVFNQMRYWYDNEHTNVISIFVDHPQYHSSRLEIIRGFGNVVVADKNWEKYIKKYMPHIKNADFLPLGGIEQTQGLSFEERENKIVFFGSYKNLNELEDEIATRENGELIWCIIERLKENPMLTIEEAIEQIAKERGCLQSMENMMVRTGLLLQVDEYIRHYYRQKVIWTIAQAGIPMDIYGWGDESVKEYPNVEVKQAVTIEQMLEICRNTRFVLNVQPWIKEGTQERVYNTMLGGSIAVTDSTKYLERIYSDKNDILFYHLENIEELPKKLQYYMDHPEEAFEISKKGLKKAQQNHTWEKRTEELVDLLNMPKNL